IDRIAEDPAARDAMGIHATLAIIALAACRGARDQHAVAWAEGGHARAYGVNHADTFVPENSTRCASRNVTLQDVQIRAADRGPRDLHDCVVRCLELRLSTIFNRFLAGSVVDEGFHIVCLLSLLKLFASRQSRGHCPRRPFGDRDHYPSSALCSTAHDSFEVCRSIPRKGRISPRSIASTHLRPKERIH